jgi:hypothetical protein
MVVMRGLIPDRTYVCELKRPWKLSTLVVGVVWLLYGALTYNFGDWDVGISLLMGGLTYLCAPWTVRVILICVRERPPWWPLWLMVALGIAWAVTDGSYVAYNKVMHHPMLRIESFRTSAALYLLAGVVWSYQGSVRQFMRNVHRIWN